MSERKLKQYHGGLIPGPSKRATDPCMQVQGSSDIQWQMGIQITACEEQTLSRFLSGEPQPLCPGVKPIKMSHLELLSESPFKLNRWDTVWDAGVECFLGLPSIFNEMFKSGTKDWKRRDLGDWWRSKYGKVCLSVSLGQKLECGCSHRGMSWSQQLEKLGSRCQLLGR